MNSWPAKDPDETLDYQINWSDRLGADTINTSTYSVVSGTVAIVSQSSADSTSTVIVSGGVDGETALLQCRIVTTGTNTLEETVSLPIRATSPAALVTSGYAAPTVSNLVTFYPAFALVPAPTITAYLTRARADVSTSWIEADYPYAVMLLACHLMAEQGLGTGSEAASAIIGGISSMRSGALSLQFATGVTDAAAAGGYGATPYGRQFLTLARRSRGGPRVSGAPPPAIGVYGAGAWPDC